MLPTLYQVLVHKKNTNKMYTYTSTERYSVPYHWSEGPNPILSNMNGTSNLNNSHTYYIVISFFT